ncbi:myosin heavy chain, skeletal muscle, adult [Podospora australis]|uniref:Myosin heavy chain, skeletal muscle, adult n=1 Tax=Podospora australis TaxID=1536484 RepID=A0AAN6WIH2_9PEZI|nr:myosin heavy chain, skeletal muscle, adult [Podospora australis]
MENDQDLPIALRRTRRKSVSQQQLSTSGQQSLSRTRKGASGLGEVKTPTKKTGKKHVRFSDPGPTTTTATTLGTPTTGLTPLIKRHSLENFSLALPTSSSVSSRGQEESSPLVTGEVHFLPLRQVLSGRVKRRIRRNGLSEEMNTILAERRQAKKDEVARLKAELAERDEEIERLHDETVAFDTDRVWELEQRVSALRRELATAVSRSRERSSSPLPPLSSGEWGANSHDRAFVMDLDDDDDGEEGWFGEGTMAELDVACSTPIRRGAGRKKNIVTTASFQSSLATPPATSPLRETEDEERGRMMTPCDSARRISPLELQGGRRDGSVQLDIENRETEEELVSLRLEVEKLTTTLERFSSLEKRLEKILASYGSAGGTSNAVEGKVALLLQKLSDKSAALSEVNTSLSGLGFAGDDALEVVSSLRQAFRTARLELEYLTPGEIALPLESAGAKVLDLLLTKLRDLAKRTKEQEDEIDEYHSKESSLRQQLSTRVTVMDSLRFQLQQAEASVKDRDSYASELELAVDRLKGAVGKYTRDLVEVEGLVEKLESDLERSHLEKEEVVEGLRKELEEKTVLVGESQEKLAQVTADLERLKSITSQINRSHGASLALRDARVTELRVEVDRVNASLREAHESVRKLRLENERLVKLNGELASENVEIAKRYDDEKQRSREVMGELEKVVKMGEGLLKTTPLKRRKIGETQVTAAEQNPPEDQQPSGSLLSGDRARKSSVGTRVKRRRHNGDEGVDVEV